MPWPCIAQVKAWCYYESRLLGAHHGLISTYALETLVLYIFNLYHATLNSSLEVRIHCAPRADTHQLDSHGTLVLLNLLRMRELETPVSSTGARRSEPLDLVVACGRIAAGVCLLASRGYGQ